MPSLNEIDSHWRLTAPERSSSLKSLDRDLQANFKRLSDRIQIAKKDSLSAVHEGHQRTSLISQLDPALIDYMTRYAEQNSSDQTYDQDSEVKSPEPSPPLHKAEAVHSPYLSVDANSELKPNGNREATGDAESESIHLFNMRISQRLASQSQIPIHSPNPSHNTSTRSLAHLNEAGNTGYGSVASLARYPTFISPEHNRRPSDPQTRKIFEAGSQRTRPNLRTWKTVTSVNSGSTSFDPNAKFAVPVADDRSSFYWSDGEIGDSRVNSPLSRSRRSSIQNPHSYAIGGRSMSANLPPMGFPNAASGQLVPSGGPSQKHHLSHSQSMASHNPSEGRAVRGRSSSMPQRPITGLVDEAANEMENMSKISVNRIMDRRNEALTEITAQEIHERRHEKLSSIGPDDARFGHTLTDSRYPRKAESGVWSQTENELVNRDGFDAECGRTVWKRAFKNALDDSQRAAKEDFLNTPKFDRDGRRRGSTKSSSSYESQTGRREGSSIPKSRSQSLHRQMQDSPSLELDSHQRLCWIAKEPLPRARSASRSNNVQLDRKRSQSVREKSKSRKMSMLDMGKRFTSAAVGGFDDAQTGTPTSMKDFLGAWARFPSHTREERNGPASDKDGVKVQDFLPRQTAHQLDRTPKLKNKASSNFAFVGSNAVKLFQGKASKRPDKAKSKSMTLRARHSLIMSPSEREKKSRVGLTGRWKRLYRSSSSETRRYANARGHRSSLSVGDAPEYPELECLPGEGMFKVTEYQRQSEMDGSAEVQANEKGMNDCGGTVDRRPAGPDWGQIYGQCVGSLSALKSEDGDVSLGSSDPFREDLDSRLAAVGSSQIRSSTYDFRKKLGRDQEKAREQLMERIDRIGNGSPQKGKDGLRDSNELRMPGGFDT
jgi:hypothetical protein